MYVRIIIYFIGLQVIFSCYTNIKGVIMIRYRDKEFKDYFIDEKTAVITDINGKILPQYLSGDRPRICIKQIAMNVHCIQAHTAWGYKGKNYHVHHKDGNPLNNALSNLEYIKHSIHSKITNIGHIVKPETRIKLSNACKNKKWFNNGIKSIMAFTCPEGFVAGRLKVHPVSLSNQETADKSSVE